MKKYTWNEIYAAAEGCGCGESGLRAKDNARENVRCLALERGEADLEEAECPEDEVEYYSKGACPLSFFCSHLNNRHDHPI